MLIIGGGLALKDDFNLDPPGPGSSRPAVLFPQTTSRSQSHLGTTTKSSCRLGGCPSSQSNRGGDFTKHHLKTIGHQESQGGLSMPGVCV